MLEMFDTEAWRQALVQSLQELGTSIAAFLPNLLGAMLVLAVGWAIAKLAEIVVQHGTRRAGLDRAARRLRWSEALQRAGVTGTLSRAVGRLTFWALLIVFLLSAVRMLGLDGVTASVDRMIAFVPRLISALLILGLGLFFARLLRDLVYSGAAAAELPQARRLASLAQYGLGITVLLVAIEQLGIATQAIVTVLAALLAAAVITVGFALSLGARPVITHILAGHFLRQSLPPGGTVEISGQRGMVERVGPVDTLIRDGERFWSVPNARLLEEIVLR